MKKVTHWELSKKSIFDHISKWYMHKPESVLTNETYKKIRNLEVQMDHLISFGQPYLLIVNKKWTLRIVDLAVPVDHRVKLKESKKSDYLHFARELKKKNTENLSDPDNNCHLRACYSYLSMSTGTRWPWNQRTTCDHLINSMVEIEQSTDKNSRGDLLSFCLSWKTIT